MGLLSQEEVEKRFNDIYYDDFDIIGHYTGCKNKIKIRCNKCGYEFYRHAGDLWRGTLSCPNCGDGCKGSNSLYVGINDLWTARPDIAKLLANPEDGYKYSYSTHFKLDFVCPDCGSIVNKRPRDLFGQNNNFRCEYCSDGYPYPEKFIRSLLDQCGIEYTYQFSSKDAEWCKGYRYDFCLLGNNILLEVNGLQHYSANHKFFKSLEEQQSIDKAKKDLANKHGYMVIEIDCSESSIEYIRDSVLQTELNTIFDLSQVDWNLCGAFAIRSISNLVCSKWDGDYSSVEKIANDLHINVVTAVKYLTEGSSIGLCDFDRDVYTQYMKDLHYKHMALNRHKPIKCVETGKIYNSFAEIRRIENMFIQGNVVDNPNRKAYGCHWVYTDEEAS